MKPAPRKKETGQTMHSGNKAFLKNAISRRLQERTRGSVVARINRLIEETRCEREGIQASKSRDPRLPPPGTCALPKLVRRVKTASKAVAGPRDPRIQPSLSRFYAAVRHS
jgi:hypothetical protein